MAIFHGKMSDHQTKSPFTEKTKENHTKKLEKCAIQTHNYNEKTSPSKIRTSEYSKLRT
jgi:hypothetical protein